MMMQNMCLEPQMSLRCTLSFDKMAKAMFAKQLGKHISLETLLVGFVDRIFTRLYRDFESNKD